MKPDPLWRALAARWRTAPALPVLRDADGRLHTAGPWLDEVDRLARWLDALGARTVGLLCDDARRSAQVQLACWRLGVTALVLPSFFVDEQLQHALGLARPDVLATDAPERVCALDAELELADGPDGGPWCLRRGDDHGHAHGDAAVITFTSGSTGRPRGVGLSGRTLLTVARSLAAVTGPQACRRHLALLHPAVLLETVGGSLRTWLQGGLLVLPRRGDEPGPDDGPALLAALTDSEASSSIVMPASLDAAVAALEAGHPAAPGLRFVGVGGARVPQRLLERALAAGLPVREGYGLSECGSVVSLDPPDAPRPGTQGRPLPHVQLTLTEDGELVVEGAAPCCLLGGELPAGAREGRWHTGDLARLTDDGRLELIGRRDNRFATPGGRNVSPEWVEAWLLEEPCLAQAVVLQAPDGWPAIVAVPRAGAQVDPAALLARLGPRLPAHARPRQLLLAPQPFSVANGEWAATGRPVRRAIAARYAALLSSAPVESLP